MIPYDEVETVT